MPRIITIDHREEETDCPQCGQPLMLGDTAYFNDITVFCSYRCALRETARKQFEREFNCEAKR